MGGEGSGGRVRNGMVGVRGGEEGGIRDESEEEEREEEDRDEMGRRQGVIQGPTGGRGSCGRVREAVGCE